MVSAFKPNTLWDVWLMVNCQKVFCFNQMPEKCTWCHNIPVIDSIHCLIKLFGLYGRLTFVIILRARLTKIWQIVMPALFTLRYKKLFLFVEAFKNTQKFKISIERINLHLTFISFCRN